MQRIFYQPPSGVSADYIPYYEDGTFYLFYLRDYRDPQNCGEGTPWYLITTTDFVSFTEHGEVLPRGTAEEQDLYVFTGSCTKYAGQYHIWYTGHNPHLRAQGKPEQAVMHAVSDDLLHWRKCPEDTFFSPADRYEPHDWRDPFLWFDEESGRWQMLLAVRNREGASRCRGETGLCSSADGIHWTVEQPRWKPGLYFAHECPDLFRMGDWYYLIYSEFSHSKVTRYRMSRSPKGPWIAPADDRFDTCAWYAAKTAGDGESRFIFGWLATREGDCDTGNWQWGGCLVVHRLIQRPDGTLAVALPDTVEKALPWKPCGKSLALNAVGGMAFETMGALDELCALDVQFEAKDPNANLTVALYADEGLGEGYFLRIEPNRSRMVLDRWPRTPEHGFEPGLERPIAVPADGKYRLKIAVQDGAGCAWLNDDTALCFRAYDRSRRHWGVIAENGAAEVCINKY